MYSRHAAGARETESFVTVADPQTYSKPSGGHTMTSIASTERLLASTLQTLHISLTPASLLAILMPLAISRLTFTGMGTTLPWTSMGCGHGKADHRNTPVWKFRAIASFQRPAWWDVGHSQAFSIGPTGIRRPLSCCTRWCLSLVAGVKRRPAVSSRQLAEPQCQLLSRTQMAS